MNTEEKLDRYAEFVEKSDELQKQMQELIDRVPVPQEVIEQWNSIKAEFQPMIDAANAAKDALLEEIKAEVLTAGSTAKGSKYMAVWNKGRESWDGKKLNGFAMAHPEILQAKNVGEPTVSIRRVK